ncbi:hypothetical protein X777_10414 [Ooceraea biroi]|uniref:Uncharacterized protein n=1 Tax=Ooceraea biroi TaxID=2015173 RepID=A0A026W4N2_OOCBI|nr:hypothetical protein X777_10414 [Ooceraea biroi]
MLSYKTNRKASKQRFKKQGRQGNWLHFLVCSVRPIKHEAAERLKDRRCEINTGAITHTARQDCRNIAATFFGKIATLQNHCEILLQEYCKIAATLQLETAFQDRYFNLRLRFKTDRFGGCPVMIAPASVHE